MWVRKVVAIVCVGLLILAESWQSHSYVQAWQSDLSLWAWTANQGSRKPRVWVNLGGALAENGRWADAGIAFQRALEAADQSYVPEWDRAVAQDMATHNLLSLRVNRLIQ